jgi:hypothetical protein
MATERDILERVEQTLARGEVWRAKEILRGNIGSRGYSPGLYERYGRLLLDVGETYEAGKYLFLSGERRPDYGEAISLYHQRIKKRSPAGILSTFPAGARLDSVSDYPEPLRAELKALGVRRTRSRGRPEATIAVPGMLASVGCFLAALVVVLLSIAGLFSVVDWLLGHA